MCRIAVINSPRGSVLLLGLIPIALTVNHQDVILLYFHLNLGLTIVPFFRNRRIQIALLFDYDSFTQSYPLSFSGRGFATVPETGCIKQEQMAAGAGAGPTQGNGELRRCLQ